MPRTARIHSVSGIYHVMLRGINRQQIFEDQEDNRFYLDLLEEYCYSSFSEYLGQPRLVDMDFVEQYISMEAVIDLSRRQIGEKCLEIADVPIHRVTDEQAKQVMKGIIGRVNAAAFQTLVPEERDRCLRKLRQSGMSIRQICRLTGASYYLVQKCTNQSGINQRTVP